MKRIYVFLLFILIVGSIHAQVISAIDAELPSIDIKNDVQLISEVTFQYDAINDRSFSVNIPGQLLQFEHIQIRNTQLNAEYVYAQTKDFSAIIELNIKKQRLVYGSLWYQGIDYVFICRNDRFFLCQKVTTPPPQECGMAEEEHPSKEKNNYIVPDRDRENDSRAAGPDDNCRVRLLIMYTDDVAVAYTDPHLTIQTAVDRINTTYNNSLVNHDVEVALIEEVTFNEFNGSGNPFSATTVIDQMEDPNDGILDYLHTLRDLYDADLVQLIMTQVNQGGGTWCGWASEILANSSNAFAVTDFDCLDGPNDHTLTHEFGHLYGCRHDVFVDPSNSPYAFGHGYVDVPNLWRTIMAYNSECEPASCFRIPNFSNPVVNWGGNPTGIVGESDNESVLDLEFTTMVNFQIVVTNKTVWDSDSVIEGDIANIRGESTITTDVNQPYNVYSGGIGSFLAGDRVVLKPGFHARTGSSFRAFLGSCTANNF